MLCGEKVPTLLLQLLHQALYSSLQSNDEDHDDDDDAEDEDYGGDDYKSEETGWLWWRWWYEDHNDNEYEYKNEKKLPNYLTT